MKSKYHLQEAALQGVQELETSFLGETFFLNVFVHFSRVMMFLTAESMLYLPII
jgi:hypothetical protein